MKKCDLCSSIARMYCESDQASLCWECDAKVHIANFLVAKHSRTLLCHSCQSITPWKSSGPKLQPTFAVCETCAKGTNNDPDHDLEHDTEDDDDEEEEEEEDDEEEEDEDNQVVPLSSSSLPPPLVSSSSSRLCSGREGNNIYQKSHSHGNEHVQ